MEYMKLSQIAKTLNVHYLTVYRWVKEGKLEAIQFGKVYRVSAEGFEKFIQKYNKK